MSSFDSVRGEAYHDVIVKMLFEQRARSGSQLSTVERSPIAVGNSHKRLAGLSAGERILMRSISAPPNCQDENTSTHPKMYLQVFPIPRTTPVPPLLERNVVLSSVRNSEPLDRKRHGHASRCVAEARVELHSQATCAAVLVEIGANVQYILVVSIRRLEGVVRDVVALLTFEHLGPASRPRRLRLHRWRPEV